MTQQNENERNPRTTLITEILKAGVRNDLSIPQLHEAFRRGLSELLDVQARKSLPDSELTEFSRRMRKLDTSYARERAALRKHALRLNSLGRIATELLKFHVVTEAIPTWDVLANTYTLHINTTVYDSLMELIPIMLYLEEEQGFYIGSDIYDGYMVRCYHVYKDDPTNLRPGTTLWRKRVAEIWVRAAEGATCGPQLVDEKVTQNVEYVYEWRC